MGSTVTSHSPKWLDLVMQNCPWLCSILKLLNRLFCSCDDVVFGDKTNKKYCYHYWCFFYPSPVIPDPLGALWTAICLSRISRQYGFTRFQVLFQPSIVLWETVCIYGTISPIWKEPGVHGINPGPHANSAQKAPVLTRESNPELFAVRRRC